MDPTCRRRRRHIASFAASTPYNSGITPGITSFTQSEPVLTAIAVVAPAQARVQASKGRCSQLGVALGLLASTRRVGAAGTECVYCAATAFAGATPTSHGIIKHPNYGWEVPGECLTSEVASKKLQQDLGAPDSEVEATSEAHRRATKARIVDAFNDSRASEWAHLWSHYVPFRSRSEEAHRVTFLCRIHFALGPWRDPESGEEERRAAMQALARWMGSEEAHVHADDATLAGFYALPHARDVARHPAFQEACRPEWIASLRGKLERVLDSALVQLQVPALARIVGQYEAAVAAVRKRMQVQEARESSTLGAAKAATAAMARLVGLLERGPPSEASLRTAKQSLAQAVSVLEAADANFQRTRSHPPDPALSPQPTAGGLGTVGDADTPHAPYVGACKHLRSLVLEAALIAGKADSPTAAAPLSVPMQRRIADAVRQAIAASGSGEAAAAERLAAADALGVLVSPAALSSLAMGVTDPAAQSSLACLLSLLAAREEGRAYLAGSVRTLPRSGQDEEADAAAHSPLAAVLQASWEWAQACLRRGFSARGPLRQALAPLHLLWRSHDLRVSRVMATSPAVLSAAQCACSAIAASVRSRDMRRAAAIALGQSCDHAVTLLLDDVAGVSQCGAEGSDSCASPTEEAVAALALVAVKPLARGAGPLPNLARRWSLEEVASCSAAVVGDRAPLVGALCRLAVAVHVLGEVAAHGEAVNATPHRRPASSGGNEARAPEECSQTLRVCTAACVAACRAAVHLVQEDGQGSEAGGVYDAALPWAVQPAAGACLIAEIESSSADGCHEVVRMKRLDAFRRLLSAAGPASDMARDAVRAWFTSDEQVDHNADDGAGEEGEDEEDVNEVAEGEGEGAYDSGGAAPTEESGNAREGEPASHDDDGEEAESDGEASARSEGDYEQVDHNADDGTGKEGEEEEDVNEAAAGEGAYDSGGAAPTEESGNAREGEPASHDDDGEEAESDGEASARSEGDYEQVDHNADDGTGKEGEEEEDANEAAAGEGAYSSGSAAPTEGSGEAREGESSSHND